MYHNGFELLKERFGPIISGLHAPLAAGEKKGFDENNMQKFELANFCFDF